MMMSPNGQALLPPVDDDDLNGYSRDIIEGFWDSFGSQDADGGSRRKKGFSILEKPIKLIEVNRYLKKKELEDLFLLYTSCMEIQASERTFCADLTDRNKKFLEIPQEQRQPYIDLSQTHAFEGLDVEGGFSPGDRQVENYNKLIQNICDDMVSHVTDPDIGTKLIITTANFDNFSKICTTSQPDISAKDSLAILPAQRTARYKSLLGTLIENAKKANNLATKNDKVNPISHETMQKLEETYKQVSQFVVLVNESIRLQENGNPLKKEEIEALLMLTRQGIFIEGQATKDLHKIANIILMKERPEDIIGALGTNGFVIDDETIKKVRAIKESLYAWRKQEVRQMFKDFSVIADSLTGNDIVPRFLPENSAQVAKEIENAIRNELPKVVMGKLKKFGFGSVPLKKVLNLKQDLYYSKIDSSISEILKKQGPITIHAENIGFGTKFARYSAGYGSTTLYIIDRMNAAFRRNDFEKMGEYLQQLGLSSEQITETMKGILDNKKPADEGYQQLKKLIDIRTAAEKPAVVGEVSTDGVAVAINEQDDPPFPPFHIMR